MYERLLDKNSEPNLEEINILLGKDAAELLKKLESFLSSNYDLSIELKFPFGNNYGWGRKYSHKKTHLIYAFFEKGVFTVTIQLGKNEVPKLFAALPYLSAKTRELWENRYPCGEGGWIHYRVLDDTGLKDVEELIEIKKKPQVKKK